MRTRLLSTCRLDDIMFVSWLRDDTFIAASSNTLIWCRLHDSSVEEARRSPCEGRLFSCFPIHDQAQAAFQIERSPRDHLLQLAGESGLIGQSVPIPLYGIHQVTADPSGWLLAIFGLVSIPGRVGWIDPVESCLIDMESGHLQRLPYSAVAFQGEVLYFVHEGTLFKRRVPSSRRLAQMSNATAPIDPTEVITSGIPATVITLAPRNGHVQVITDE